MYRDFLSESLFICEFKFTLHLITKYFTQNHYGQENQIYIGNLSGTLDPVSVCITFNWMKMLMLGKRMSILLWLMCYNKWVWSPKSRWSSWGSSPQARHPSSLASSRISSKQGQVYQLSYSAHSRHRFHGQNCGRQWTSPAHAVLGHCRARKVSFPHSQLPERSRNCIFGFRRDQ